MISIIFKKLVNNQKGGVEFVESSIVFPIIQVFILLLIILSLNTFNKIYTFEKVYKESRSEFYSKEKGNQNINIAKSASRLFEEKSIFSKLRINNREFNFENRITIFNNHVDSFEDQKMYLSTNKMDTDDIIRKLDFMKNVYLDIKDLKSFKKIDSFTDTINNMKDNLMKKIIKW